MTNELIKRLRNTPNWQRESYGDWKQGTVHYDRAPFEAADALEAQAAEIERYKTQWAEWSSSLDSVMKQRNELQAKLDAAQAQEVDGNALLQAIARGWCSEKNKGKVMDPLLALAIRDEVQKLYASPVVQHPQAQQEVDELAFEIALAELVDKICPGLDSGDLLDDARTASMKLTHMIEPAIGGRESVEDALEIVESFGPGVAGVNDSYARQILLAAEVKRLRAVHPQATEPAWWPIESAPEGELVATVWSDTDGTRYSFDYLEDGVWQNHFNDYEHLVIAGAPGRAEDAPYTHWMPLPAAPAIGGQQP